MPQSLRFEPIDEPPRLTGSRNGKTMRAMIPSDLPALAEAVAKWADNLPCVWRVYLYGSRTATSTAWARRVRVAEPPTFHSSLGLTLNLPGPSIMGCSIRPS